MERTCEVVGVPGRMMACIRVQVPLDHIGDSMRDVFHRVVAAAEARGIELTGPPFCRYYSHDPTAVDFEAGMPIVGAAEHSDELCVCTVGGGKAATTLHVGPYDDLGDSYAALIGWMKEQGLSSSGPMWEVYLTDPTLEPDPTKWQTRIYIPVAV